MLDDLRPLPESLRKQIDDKKPFPFWIPKDAWQGCDIRIASYYNDLRELENLLDRLAYEYDAKEKTPSDTAGNADEGAPIELTDYLFIENA